MKPAAFIRIIVLVLFIAAFLIYYRYDLGRKEKLLEILNIKFSPTTIDEGFAGIVTSIYQGDLTIFRNHPHQAYITLDDSIRRNIRTGYELKTNQKLDDILQVGDRLIKNPFSDSLYILKFNHGDSLTLRFQLDDELGYPLVKKEKHL